MELGNILGLIGIGISLLVTGCNIAFFAIIKFNDFVHVEKKQCEMDKKLDLLLSEQTELKIAVAEIATRCHERHDKRPKRMRKSLTDSL